MCPPCPLVHDNRCRIGGISAFRRGFVAKAGRIEGKINESLAACLDSVIIG
jgi:hypothetical protein